jgi:hypothetical protein
METSSSGLTARLPSSRIAPHRSGGGPPKPPLPGPSMRADRDKCITCGSRDQSTSIPFQDLPYFFCCEDCHKKAVRKYLNKRYDFDADLSQDEDFQREWEEIDDAYAVIPEGHGLWAQLKGITEHNWKTPRQEALVERWHKARVDAIADAENEIYKRLRAELDHEEQEEAEELEKERLKQEEREAKERLQQEQQEAKQREHEEMLVEKPIPNRFRFEHSHVLGPSGSGKTTLAKPPPRRPRKKVG